MDGGPSIAMGPNFHPVSGRSSPRRRRRWKSPIQIEVMAGSERHGRLGDPGEQVRGALRAHWAFPSGPCTRPWRRSACGTSSAQRSSSRSSSPGSPRASKTAWAPGRPCPATRPRLRRSLPQRPGAERSLSCCCRSFRSFRRVRARGRSALSSWRRSAATSMSAAWTPWATSSRAQEGKGASALRVLAAAHMDEVGLIVTQIEDTGLLRFAKVGGIDDRVLPARAVFVGDSRVPGVDRLQACSPDRENGTRQGHGIQAARHRHRRLEQGRGGKARPPRGLRCLCHRVPRARTGGFAGGPCAARRWMTGLAARSSSSS